MSKFIPQIKTTKNVTFADTQGKPLVSAVYQLPFRYRSHTDSMIGLDPKEIRQHLLDPKTNVGNVTSDITPKEEKMLEQMAIAERVRKILKDKMAEKMVKGD